MDETTAFVAFLICLNLKRTGSKLKMWITEMLKKYEQLKYIEIAMPIKPYLYIRGR